MSRNADPVVPQPPLSRGTAEEWNALWQTHRPMMLLLAMRKLLEAGQRDAEEAAEDIVQTVQMNLFHTKPDLPRQERVELLLVACVKNAVISELRARRAARGRYGAGGDAGDLLEQLPQAGAPPPCPDRDWSQKRRRLVEQALERVRRQTPPLEWQAYYLRLKNVPAAEAVAQLNEQFRPDPPLKEPQIYPCAYRVQKRFYNEVCRLGVIPENENPRSLIPLLREVLGLTSRTGPA